MVTVVCPGPRTSSAFESQNDTVIADLATYPPVDGDTSARWHLCRLASAIVLLKASRRRCDAKAAEGFICEDAQTPERRRYAVKHRWPRPGVKARTYFHESPIPDQLTQSVTNLFIASQIREVCS
jgi:hypothetical protein